MPGSELRARRACAGIRARFETMHKKLRFYASDLRKLHRNTIDAVDPHTNKRKTCEALSFKI
jgi:hypothetical protein